MSSQHLGGSHMLALLRPSALLPPTLGRPLPVSFAVEHDSLAAWWDLESPSLSQMWSQTVLPTVRQSRSQSANTVYLHGYTNSTAEPKCQRSWTWTEPFDFQDRSVGGSVDKRGAKLVTPRLGRVCRWVTTRGSTWRRSSRASVTNILCRRPWPSPAPAAAARPDPDVAMLERAVRKTGLGRWSQQTTVTNRKTTSTEDGWAGWTELDCGGWEVS